MDGEQRGYDGGKKVHGRKRHLLVDTEGLALKAKVYSAETGRGLCRSEAFEYCLEKTVGGEAHLLVVLSRSE